MQVECRLTWKGLCVRELTNDIMARVSITALTRKHGRRSRPALMCCQEVDMLVSLQEESAAVSFSSLGLWALASSGCLFSVHMSMALGRYEAKMKTLYSQAWRLRAIITV